MAPKKKKASGDAAKGEKVVTYIFCLWYVFTLESLQESMWCVSLPFRKYILLTHMCIRLTLLVQLLVESVVPTSHPVTGSVIRQHYLPRPPSSGLLLT